MYKPDQTPEKKRIYVLIVLIIFSLVLLSFSQPIPQDQAYHLFADTRELLSIPNFNNVISNFGFALAGILGLLTLLGVKQKSIFENPRDKRPYIVFFAGVTLISLGSGYYHLSPDDERLFWDRLAMSISFMGFISAIVADRINRTAGTGWLLTLLVVMGILSLVYWITTEAQGNGDLRFYAFAQFFPVILLPAILWLFPGYRLTNPRYLGWIIAWYVLAKFVEHYDHEVFELTSGIVSGHTLKHLAAAMGAYVVVKMLRERVPQDGSPIHSQ